MFCRGSSGEHPRPWGYYCCCLQIMWLSLFLQDLLFSYNIAVDRSNEMTKVLGKSAASVGLRLPDVYQS